MVKKTIRPFRIAVPVAALSLAASPVAAQTRTVAANALPTGFEVIKGGGSAATTGNVLDVTQTGQRAVFGWKSFDIGSAATVNFHQERNAVALNVIGGNDASAIYGKLNADGQVFFTNPHGMLFARGASVNVGGLLATTMGIGAEEFMKGNVRLANPGGGAIRNEGIINAAGSVALVGNTVENTGSIFATTVTLAAGNSVAVDLTGDGLIRARVEDAALKASIVNSNTIEATAAVTLTAGQARDTLDRVVNNSGVIRAKGLVQRGGDILLEGGYVANSGTLDASGTTGRGGSVSVRGRDVALAPGSVIDASGTSGGTVDVFGDLKAGRLVADGVIRAAASGPAATDNGGFIETSAAEVRIADGFRIDARSAHGRAGNWLIDPIDFYITAGSGSLTSSGIGATTLSNALAGLNVTIVTDGSTGGNGDIFVNSPISWSANQLKLSAHRNIYINQNLNGSGTARLFLQYGIAGAGGDYFVARGAKVYLPAGNNFATQLAIDGPIQNYTVIRSLGVEGDTTTATLQGMKNGLAGLYALGDDIEAYDTRNWNLSGGVYWGFTPIGWEFNGKFHGLGHTIKNLTINSPGSNCVGLFQTVVGATTVIRDVGLTNANITGNARVGAIAGFIGGTTIRNSYATGTVRGSGGSINSIGGLVGYLDQYGSAGIVTDSYAAVDVAGAGNSIGGLVGYNFAGKVLNSYATGNVSGGSYVGGLVGASSSGYGGGGGDTTGTILNSYATGAVSGTGNQVGGLVGYLSTGKIVNSYAAGAVSGNLYVGGLVGLGPTGYTRVVNSFWDTTTTGQNSCNGGADVYNCTGYTTADMKRAATFSDAGWSIANSGGSTAVWRIYEGQTYPLLRNLLAPLVVTADSKTKTYGNADPALTYQVTSGNLLDGHTLALTRSAGENVGTYGVDFVLDPVYDISYTGSNFGITPAMLSVSAIAKTKVYGAEDPALDYRLTGLVNNALLGIADTADSVLSGALSRALGETVEGGPYAITQGTLTASSNYLLSFTGSTLTITAPPTASAAGGTSAAVAEASSAVQSAAMLEGPAAGADSVGSAAPPPAAQGGNTLLVANSTVDKPVEEIAVRGRAKGRALVCRR